MKLGEALSNFRGHRVPHLTIIERKRFWFALSGFFVLLSVLGLAVRGLNFSIDFKGGSLLKYPCPKCVSAGLTSDDVRAVLGRFGLSDAEVQVVNGDTMTVRTRSLTSLGGRPATILRLPNTSGVSAQQLEAALAEFGHSQSSVSASQTGITIHAQPLTQAEHGVTLTYPNTKNLTPGSVQTQLSGLGYAGAEVNVYGSTSWCGSRRFPFTHRRPRRRRRRPPLPRPRYRDAPP